MHVALTNNLECSNKEKIFDAPLSFDQLQSDFVCSLSEFYRCTINITSLQYQDELGDTSSVAFRELSGKVASAIQLQFDGVPGQQTVVVLQFR